jgi:hypothetical protein
VEKLKQAAATEAVDGYVESGMTVGLGTGSTAFWAVKRLGELLNRGNSGTCGGSRPPRGPESWPGRRASDRLIESGLSRTLGENGDSSI